MTLDEGESQGGEHPCCRLHMRRPLRRLLVQPDRDIVAYESIPIRFLAECRVDLEALQREQIVPLAIHPFWKDYDASPFDRPAAVLQRYPRAEVFLVREGERAVGGAILAYGQEIESDYGCPGSAVVLDLRVAPERRGQGVGRALWRACEERAAAWGCRSMLVETQDINLPACRLYQRCGCVVHEVDPHGYAPTLDEAKIVWRRDLPPRASAEADAR